MPAIRSCDCGADKTASAQATAESVEPKCAGLEGCHELEGVMYDLFVHDPKCLKGADESVGQEPLKSMDSGIMEWGPVTAQVHAVGPQKCPIQPPTKSLLRLSVKEER